ncbi:bifunctional riboflavin kinase/FAD synthetase [Apibacter sp. HY039]|uniref:bifunctional riboflavin kinase/FAD synthetase n=1 Tax=Apibacter sp. HY039 TaxID=2501476 RepID=UPI002101D5AD|nr:bifunctional riboflavin kinase/FAD synthetase [Apibacter sp. HY039]
MKIQREKYSLPQDKKIIFTLGMFDGVHLGHRFILNYLDEIAKKEDGETAIMTFNPHPRFVLQPDTDFRLLTTLQEKINLLSELSIQHLFIQEFSKEFSRLSSLEFVRDILVAKLNIHSLVVGYDHQFGRNRDGNFEQLQTFSEMFEFKLYQLPPISENEMVISSTKIRNKILEGDISTANSWLGYKFIMTGKVVEGNKLGRQLGFPTANIDIDAQKICPKNGVYFVKVSLKNKFYHGMMNIGMRPTVNGLKKQIEVNILDFDQDIYGEQLEIHFYDRERDEQKFSSIEDLKKQLYTDRENTRDYFREIS